MPLPQPPTRIIQYGQNLMARIIATDAYAFARPILIEVGAEVLGRARVHAVSWGAKYVSVLSFFGATDVLLAQTQGF